VAAAFDSPHACSGSDEKVKLPRLLVPPPPLVPLPPNVCTPPAAPPGEAGTSWLLGCRGAIGAIGGIGGIGAIGGSDGTAVAAAEVPVATGFFAGGSPQSASSTMPPSVGSRTAATWSEIFFAAAASKTRVSKAESQQTHRHHLV